MRPRRPAPSALGREQAKWQRLSAALTALLLVTAESACTSEAKHPRGRFDPGAVRYRLLLHENPVSAPLAYRCYARCQAEPTPESYVKCLTACPGFEITPGISCGPHDVPPEAACFTARKVPLKSEPDPGQIVLAVVAQTAIVVGLASVCGLSSTSCLCGNPSNPACTNGL